MAAGAVAADSSIAAITVPLLPELGRHGAVVLFFVRPVVGLTASVLLPLILASGSHRGRMAAVVGLTLLSLACAVFAAASSFWMVFLARVLSAAASGLVLGPLVHCAMLQEPVERAGWRLNATMYGVAIGSACGPWLGSSLASAVGVQGMLVVMALVAIGMSATLLAVSEWAADLLDHTAAACDDAGSVGHTLVNALLETLQDAKQRVLLAGLGLHGAALALHGTLMPLYLTQPGTLSGVPESIGYDCLGGAVMGASLLVCGLLSDALSERQAATVMVASAAMGSLGLRAIVYGHTAAKPVVLLAGMLASHAGLGQYIGISLPMLARLTRSCSGLPMLIPTAVVCATFSSVWLLGECLGVGAQVVLCPSLGFDGTIYVFAITLALHAATVLSVPGWLRISGAKSAEQWSTIVSD